MNQRIRQILPYFIIIIISAILINNMFYGFTWTDEGLYLSNVQRLVDGDRLLIDDWTPTQFYAPLLYPIYKIYININGDTEGIFVFFRIFTITIQTLISLVSFYIFSKKYSKTESFFASVFVLIFSRASINGPSYYTLGFVFYFFGCLLCFAFFSEKKSFSYFFIAGFAFAVSILCIPFLMIPYLFFLFFCFFLPCLRKNLFNFFIIWSSTVFVGIIYIVFFLSQNSIQDILLGMQYSYNDPAYPHGFLLMIKRLYKMPKTLIDPYFFIWLPMICVFLFIKFRKIELSLKQKCVVFSFNTLLFLLCCFYKKDCAVAVVAFFHYTAMNLLFFSKGSLRQFFSENKKELVFFIMPGLLFAEVFCFTSDQKFNICGIGMTICAAGEIFILSRIIPIFAIKNKIGKNIIRVIPLLLLFGFTLYYRINDIYRDKILRPHLFFIPKFYESLVQLQAGPAKYIYTTEQNKVYYDDLLILLNELGENGKKKIFISEIACWAYISNSNLSAATPTTWRIFFNDERLKSYFEIFPKYDFPDYIIDLDSKNPNNSDAISVEGNWLGEELKRRNYVYRNIPSGILYYKE